MERTHQQHEMRGRLTDFRTRHHQTKVLRRDMLTTSFEAVGHRRAEAGRVAGLTFFDAGRHFRRHLVHR
jgi:hypothetical protein